MTLRQIVDVIIPHFDKYTLITHKLADYLLFARYWCGWLRQPYHSSCGERRFNEECQEHLTLEGLRKIISIKASLNLGLSDELKVAFPRIVAVIRPLILDKKIPSPEWMAGFTSSGDAGVVYFVNHTRTVPVEVSTLL